MAQQIWYCTPCNVRGEVEYLESEGFWRVLQKVYAAHPNHGGDFREGPKLVSTLHTPPEKLEMIMKLPQVV
jgi:hypothetical protein